MVGMTSLAYGYARVSTRSQVLDRREDYPPRIAAAAVEASSAVTAAAKVRGGVWRDVAAQVSVVAE
jgi:hypothetical protein